MVANGKGRNRLRPKTRAGDRNLRKSLFVTVLVTKGDRGKRKGVESDYLQIRKHNITCLLGNLGGDDGAQGDR